jgi:hypothetical protein
MTSYKTPFHRFVSAEGDMQHWIQFADVPNTLTPEQLLVMIAEIEKEEEFSWLWNPTAIGNLAHVAHKTEHADLKARCTLLFQRARDQCLAKPHLCKPQTAGAAVLSWC